MNVWCSELSAGSCATIDCGQFVVTVSVVVKVVCYVIDRFMAGSHARLRLRVQIKLTICSNPHT